MEPGQRPVTDFGFVYDIIEHHQDIEAAACCRNNCQRIIADLAKGTQHDIRVVANRYAPYREIRQIITDEVEAAATALYQLEGRSQFSIQQLMEWNGTQQRIMDVLRERFYGDL